MKDDVSLKKFQSIFEKSVIPLLQEYFYEDYQKIQLVLGDNAKSSDDLKFILDEKVVVKNIFKGSVEDVVDLPTMKSQGAAKNEANNAAQETKPVEKIDFSKVKVEPLFEEMVDFDTFSKSDFRAVKVKACEAVKKSKKLLQFTLDDGTGTDRTILSGIHAYYEPEELVGKTLIAITNLPPRAMMGIDSCGMLLSAIHEEEGEEKLHLLMVDDHIPAGAKLY